MKLLLLFAIFSPMVLLSQITWQTPEISNDVQQICKNETGTIKFTLDQNTTDAVVTINLPNGYVYAGNEIMTGGTLKSTDSSDPQNPQFTFDSLTGQEVILTVEEQATCSSEGARTQNL